MTHTTETYNKQIKQVLKQLPSYRSLLTMFRPFLLAISMTGVRVILDKDAWPNFDWQYLWLASEWSSLTKLGPISVGNIYDWRQSDPRWRSSAPFLLAISMTGVRVILVDEAQPHFCWQYLWRLQWSLLTMFGPFLLAISMTGIRVILVDEAWSHFYWHYLWLSVILVDDVWSISFSNIYNWR